MLLKNHHSSLDETRLLTYHEAMNTQEVLLQAIRDSYRRIGKPPAVLLALSGGADSVALLHLLMMLQQEESFTLSAVHINHGLREASTKEEEFVRTLAAASDMPLHIKRVSVSRTGNLEAAARTARYAAFVEVLKASQSNVLALAHHAGDQAETVMMHLMRGAGLDGLSGMEEYRAPYWRPLLLCSKALLLEYLDDEGISHVLDESNLDLRFLRNDLRHNVLTRLEGHAPGAIVRIAKTAQMLRDENRLLKSLEDSWLMEYARMDPPFVFLLTAPFMEEPEALQRRLLRRLAAVYEISLDFEQTERLRAQVLQNQPGPINLPGGLKGFLSRERLHILHDDVKLTKRFWPQPLMAPAGEGMGDGLRDQVVDADRIQGAEMRPARRGDVISPLGTSGSQTIWKYLSARKVDQPFRPFWPVYARGSRVLWVPGCGVSADAAVTADTASRIRLVFTGTLPHEITRVGGEET